MDARDFNLQDTLALLRVYPATLNSLLRNLPESWLLTNEGQGTWNVREILLHLIRSERVNWIPRLQSIIEHGETQVFPAFDRPAADEGNRTVAELLDEFVEERARTLRELEAFQLTPHDLGRTGLHPTFGRVTLSQLLATWATHDMTHLHQIARVMARRYEEAVGPWKRFLGVLHCNGHSD